MDVPSPIELASPAWSPDELGPNVTDEERAAIARDHAEMRVAITGVSMLLILVLLVYALAHEGGGTRAVGMAGLFIAGISAMAGLLSAQHDDAYAALTARLTNGSAVPQALPPMAPLFTWCASLYRFWPYFYTATFALGCALYFIGGI